MSNRKYPGFSRKPFVFPKKFNKVIDDDESSSSSSDEELPPKKLININKRIKITLKTKDLIPDIDKAILGKLCSSLDDLILIGETFFKYNQKYNYKEMNITEYRFESLNKIAKMSTELKLINEMIGMEKIKKQLVSQIAYLLANYKQSILMHTVISGPPGHGKTEIAKLIGNAYFKSGILTSSKFVCASRSELIGRYLGQTAGNTKAMFKKAEGGVIFIDEIYALGGGKAGDDIYSKECIDTINQLLTEQKDTMCIIAGYGKEMDECFFSVNKGLESRFPWRFEIEKYKGCDLYQIFLLQIKKGNWTLDTTIINPEFFNKYKEYFKNAGRDVENFYVKCCIAHAARLFLDSNDKVLTNEDINAAIKVFKEIKELTIVKDEPPFGMYI